MAVMTRVAVSQSAGCDPIWGLTQLGVVTPLWDVGSPEFCVVATGTTAGGISQLVGRDPIEGRLKWIFQSCFKFFSISFRFLCS